MKSLAERVVEIEFTELFPGKITDQLADSRAGQQRRQPHRIEVQYQKTVLRIEQFSAQEQQLVEILLQNPLLAVRSATV